MWVIHHFSQSGCLSYLNFSQILSAVLTDSQNNIQQPREPDVLTVTHHMCGGGKQHLHTSNCLMWTETGKVWNAPKQTKKKALNLFTAMLSKIEIHLFEMSDMNDATKEKKLHSHIFYKCEPGQRRFIISMSVFTPAELIIKKWGDESH